MEGKREAAPVLAHGKRQTKTSKYIISAKRIACNTISCVALGLSFPQIMFGSIFWAVTLFALSYFAAREAAR